MKFIYTGHDKAGESVKETVEATDRFAVYEIAREQGHRIDTVTGEGKFSLRSVLNIEKVNYYLSRIKSDDLVLATRNLGAMLVAGLPLSRAISVIERQSKNPRLKGVMATVRERINKGNQFHEALAEFPGTFDDLYVAMVKAGEESGGLSEALRILSVQLERSSNLKKKIKGAMIYPVIVISIMFIIGFLMMIFVMPTLISTFESLEVELPATTQFMIGMSKFLSGNTVLSLVILFSFFASVIYFLRTKIGKIASSWTIIRVPVIGKIAKEANSARTARTLSSLLTSGVDVLRALEITAEVVQNHFYRQVLEEASIHVEKGNPLSEIFIANEKLYPVFVGEMVSVGEETGKISEMLEQLATFYENEVEHKTKDLSTIIEPLLMVVIGGGVGFFALAMISPIYSLSDAI